MTRAQETHYRELIDLEKTLKLMARVSRNERINPNQFEAIRTCMVKYGSSHRYLIHGVVTVDTISWLGWALYDDPNGAGERLSYTDHDGVCRIIVKYKDDNKLLWI